jgi:ribosomal protein S18 acetylase RimI-like enzyme
MTGEKQAETLVLRRATIDDAPAIRALTREAYAKWVPLIGREPLPMLADYAEAAQQHRIDLLYLTGKLAALIEMIPLTGHLLIENVAVAPALQRRGLGGKLLAHAEAVAVALGYGEIRLYTNERFAGNVRLYGKLGYRIDRKEEFGGSTRVHMSKRLASRNAPICSTSP